MKKERLLFRNFLRKGILFSVSLLAGASMFAQDVTNGLEIHYTFSTTDGIMVADVVGGLNGTLTGGATIGAAADGRDVLNLDGTPEMFFDMEDAVGEKIKSLTDFSISTFVFVNAGATWARIFDFGSGTNYYMFLSPVAEGGNIRFSFKNGGSEEQINTTSPIAIGRWVHLAVTLEGGTGRMYVDGIEAGINESMTLNPLSIGEPFSQNYLGKSMWPDPILDGQIADFRVYSRAVTADEVLVLAGTPNELVIQYNALDLVGLEEVVSDIALPETLGTGGVTVKWASSDTAVIDSVGHVTRPQSYNAAVILTATLSMEVDGKMYELKKSFNVAVLALVQAADLVANWTFEDDYIDWSNLDTIVVEDASENGFVGKVRNDANIITIGETNQFNVLDLGNGTGYFDMGTDIGEVMYDLGEYTMSCYFRINEDYAELNNNGNFIWNFSNSVDAPTDQNGYIIGSLKNQSQSITTNYWAVGDQGVGASANAPKGGWHHMTFTSIKSVGTVYIDGQVVASGAMTHLPSTALPKEGMSGTPFNWLGRSCYPGDVYLRETLLYDFRIYAFGVSQDDILFGLEVETVLNDLDAAYQENPNASYPAELEVEEAALDLGDLSAVVSDLTLPVAGPIDNSITITWSSTNGAISNAGVVTRPDFFGADVVLTATLSKRGYTATKEFPASVLVKDGTPYTSDLLLHYSFASNLVNGLSVTDASEKAFTGTLMNGAVVRNVTDGINSFDVLDLRTDTAYFDMGEECGKIIYGLNDEYSISVYFLVDPLKTNFADNGNFVYTFSNSDTSDVYRNGYMFGRASIAIHDVSSHYWAQGNQNTEAAPPVSVGYWHHMVYVQSDTLGTLYLDGDTVSSVSFKTYPSVAIPKEGMMGTMYNWLGRPNFGADAYLGKAMIHDFKLWNKSLAESEVANMQPTLAALEAAYAVWSPIDEVHRENSLRVDVSTPGLIRILDLKGDEKVSVFELTGRRLSVSNVNMISARSGVYIVTVNDKAQKVFVK